MNRTLPYQECKRAGAFGISAVFGGGKWTSVQVHAPHRCCCWMGSNSGTAKVSKEGHGVPDPVPESRASHEPLLTAVRPIVSKKQVFPEIRRHRGKCLVFSFKRHQPKLCSCPGGKPKWHLITDVHAAALSKSFALSLSHGISDLEGTSGFT